MSRVIVLNQSVAAVWSRLVAFLLVLLISASIHAQQTVLETIPLRYRTVPEIVPIIQPMLAPGGSVSGFQGQLVVRTTPANLEEVKRILASLDTPPRQLLITVREEAETVRSRNAAEISGSAGGEHGRLTVPGGSDPRGGNVVLRDGDDNVRLHVLEGGGRRGASGMQSVRVMEGREAFLRIGQSMPVRERHVQRSVVSGRVVEQVVESTQYRDATSGVYVVPRVSGDLVTLEISTQRESFSRPPQRGTSVQSVVTTVSGRLGEWIEIGGVAQDSNTRQSVLLGRADASTRTGERVLIKVEEVR